MKKSLLALLPMFFLTSFAEARVQFSCSADGIPGQVLISDEAQGLARVSFNGSDVAVQVKDDSALNAGISRYDSSDKRVAIALMSRGMRWDGQIVLDGTSHAMSCDYK